MKTSDKLRFLADKLNNMWGKSPDADLIRQAADEMDAASETPAEEPKAPTKRTTKKDS
jgi:hypothetical protein